MRFLIVEDDPDGAEMVEMMLDSAGAETAIVNSGEAGLAELAADPQGFTAGIIDMALPEMDGFQFLDQVRRNPLLRDIPLIAVTAYHTPELKMKALDAGFDAYFAKPLDTNLFVQSLEKLLS